MALTKLARLATMFGASTSTLARAERAERRRLPRYGRGGKIIHQTADAGGRGGTGTGVVGAFMVPFREVWEGAHVRAGGRCGSTYRWARRNAARESKRAMDRLS